MRPWVTSGGLSESADDDVSAAGSQSDTSSRGEEQNSRLSENL